MEVTAGASVSGFNFILQEQRGFTVGGRVVVAGGLPLPREQVSVLLEPVDGDLLRMSPDNDGEVDSNGAFTFLQVRPGRFKLIGWVVEEDHQKGNEVITRAPPKWNITKTDLEVNGDLANLVVTISPAK